mmetsp:Transcript_10845/g.23106  ORF Transcript_10845/g.23106 Transcript_10845/m.23106 type:complete len:408 (+) Transcript_10845:214-1437(+)
MKPQSMTTALSLCILGTVLQSSESFVLTNPNANANANERRGGYSMSAGGAALQFLVDALEETGGRAVFWTWRRPNYGLGALVDRERLETGNHHSNQNNNNNNAGISLYVPLQDTTKVPHRDPNTKEAAEFYAKLGERCIQAKVALDIVVHTNPDVPQSFLDLATLGRLCETSSGRLIWIDKLPYGSSSTSTSTYTDVWKKAMLEEVMRPLYWSGWDAVFKIRCSKGLQVRGMLSSVGSLMAPSSLSGQEDEVEFSVVTPETCIAVTLEHRVGGLPSPNNNNNSSSSNNNNKLHKRPRCDSNKRHSFDSNSSKRSNSSTNNTSSNNNTTNNSSTSNNNNNNNPVVLREDAGETPPTKDHRRPPVAVWTLFRASTACPWAYRPVGVATAARLLPDLLLAGVRNHNRTDG